MSERTFLFHVYEDDEAIIKGRQADDLHFFPHGARSEDVVRGQLRAGVHLVGVEDVGLLRGIVCRGAGGRVAGV